MERVDQAYIAGSGHNRYDHNTCDLGLAIPWLHITRLL
jgi:hypothetical protein